MTPRKRPRLSTTVFRAVSAYSLVMVACFACLFASLFYFTQEQQAERQLAAMARSAAQELNRSDQAQTLVLLNEQFEEGVRFCLIASDGSVIFDSSGEASGDHRDRPEIREALEQGEGTVARYSQTLGEDTVYAAVALESGDVLRLSEQRMSLLSFCRSLAPAFLVALAAVAVLAVALSRLLTRRIIAPLNSVDVSRPLDNDTYAEMVPLLSRIDDQQHQLREQNCELARAEGLRREFSANVSHEMKSPLQVIVGYAELLAAGTVSAEDAPRFASIIHSEAESLGALIDDVLVLSRLDDPVSENAGKEKLDLLELAALSARRLEPLAEAGEVTVRVLGSPTEITGNGALLAQVAGNLIANAIRYTEPGGLVTVTVGQSVARGGGDKSREAFIRVRDTGIGIAPEEQAKVFERFYRVDKSRSRERGGTGLGLAIAKHGAAFHGGTIELESVLGEGSTFTVFLPMA